MRTTIDLDTSVVHELKQRSRRTGKSMGQIASELLARSLRDDDKGAATAPKFSWTVRDLGLPRIDLEDKEAVRAALDSRR